MTFTAEYTDTFGGEANYSWVHRVSFEMPDNASQAAIMRRAKRELGISGTCGKTVDDGEGYKFTPYRRCVVLFVYPVY